MLVYGVLLSVDVIVVIMDLFRGVYVIGWIFYNFSFDLVK